MRKFLTILLSFSFLMLTACGGNTALPSGSDSSLSSGGDKSSGLDSNISSGDPSEGDSSQIDSEDLSSSDDSKATSTDKESSDMNTSDSGSDNKPTSAPSSKPSSGSSSGSVSQPSQTVDLSFLDEYDKKKNSLVMDIGGWFSPEQTEASFKAYADAGLNMIFLQGEHGKNAADYEASKQGLQLSAKYGLKAYLWAQSFNSEFAHDYSDFSAFEGFVYDEPDKAGLDMLASGSLSNFKGRYPGKTFYVNLYPTYVGSGHGFKNYREYVDETYKKILSKLNGPKWLSVDYYPLIYRDALDENGKTYVRKYIDANWLLNIEMVAEKKKLHPELQTHFFIQAMGFGTDRRQPDAEDLGLQAYVLMAFGIDSFSYFCYYTPPTGGEFNEGMYALIKRDGSKSDLYHAAKKLNNDILFFDHVYFQFEWQGVYGHEARGERNNAFYNLQNSMRRLPATVVSNFESTEDALVGYFEDKDRRPGLMLVNYTETSLNLTNKIDIEFKDAVKVVVYKDGKRSVADTNQGKFSIQLKKGEAAFIIPVK